MSSPSKQSSNDEKSLSSRSLSPPRPPQSQSPSSSSISSLFGPINSWLFGPSSSNSAGRDSTPNSSTSTYSTSPSTCPIPPVPSSQILHTKTKNASSSNSFVKDSIAEQSIASKLISSIASVFTSKQAEGEVIVDCGLSMLDGEGNIDPQVTKNVVVHVKGDLSQTFKLLAQDIASLDSTHDCPSNGNHTSEEFLQEFESSADGTEGQAPDNAKHQQDPNRASDSLKHVEEIRASVEENGNISIQNSNDSGKAVVNIVSKSTSIKKDGRSLYNRITHFKINSIPPFDLQLSTLPSFILGMNKLLTLQIQNHKINTLPLYLIYYLPLLEILELQNNKIHSFLTVETSTSSQSSSNNIDSSSTYSPFISTSRPQSPSLSDGKDDNLKKRVNSMEDLSQYGFNVDMIRKTKSQDVTYFMKNMPIPRLQRLNVSNNCITSIPPHISLLSNLKELILINNELHSLPDDLYKLALETLDLSGNSISNLPTPSSSLNPIRIRLFKSLKHISLSKNYIKAPLITLSPKGTINNLELLPQLTSVDLSHNFFEPLPNSLIRIAASILHLDLSHNGIKTLVPNEIKSFTSLTTINLSHNRISQLPVEIFTLKSITHLDLGHNSLTNLPSNGFPAWKFSLKTLDISYNQIQQIPHSFCTLMQLNHVNISHNQLNDAALTIIVELKNLTWLDASANLFTELPELIANLQQLRYFNISYNENITKIPQGSQFPSLTHLELLQLPKLAALPNSLSDVSSLKTIIVSGFSLSYHEFGDVYYTHDGKSLTEEAVNAIPSTKDSSCQRTNSNTIRHRHIEVATIDGEIPNVHQLIILMISCPHELLVGGLTQLCIEEEWHEELLKIGLFQELGKLIFWNQSSVQLRALKAIKTICRNPNNHYWFLTYLESLDMLFDLFASSYSKLQQDQLSRMKMCFTLDSLCYLAFNTKLRLIISSHVFSAGDFGNKKTDQQLTDSTNSIPISKLINELCNMTSDPTISARAKRTRSGLGIAPPLVAENGKKRGLRILSIDGGGNRGFIILIMLNALEVLTGKRMSEMFDLIIGTSTGGLIAGLAAWTHFDMEQCIPYYRLLCKSVFCIRGGIPIPPPIVDGNRPTPVPPLFSNGSDDLDFFGMKPQGNLRLSSSGEIRNPSSKPGTDSVSTSANSDQTAKSEPLNDPPLNANQTQQATYSNSKFAKTDPAAAESGNKSSSASEVHASTTDPGWLSMASLAKVNGLMYMIQSKGYYESGPMETIIRDLSGGDVSLLDTTMVTNAKFAIVSTQANIYPPKPYILRNYNVNEAPNRTAPLNGNSYFYVWESIRATTAAPGYFDPFVKDNLHLIDGALVFNNPAAVGVMEAKSVWPDESIDLLLSCGTGIGPNRPTDVTVSVLLSELTESATETEKTASIMETLMPKDTYFRLQPVHQKFADFPLDSVDMAKFDEIEAYMIDWLKEQHDKLEKIAAILTDR